MMMNSNAMVQELNDNELDLVNGGYYYEESISYDSDVVPVDWPIVIEFLA